LARAEGADDRLVLGTAGHIDHGKTALIRALTGVDTDRLPEEKARGITIELGFAPLDLADDLRVGVVDVPGHEGLVRTMVAGATGIDLVLLVVAADEGVMPQTREHLAICDLLGLAHGVVALTKIDLADPDVVELAEEEVRELVAPSALAAAPIVRVSAQTGDGIEALREVLIETALRSAAALGGPALRGQGIRERGDRDTDRWSALGGRHRGDLPDRTEGSRARSPELRRLVGAGESGSALRGEPPRRGARGRLAGAGGLGVGSAAADPGSRRRDHPASRGAAHHQADLGGVPGGNRRAARAPGTDRRGSDRSG